ncbi:MAG: entericidin A/B family lipoprotein [Roseovarius sp.]
MKNITAMLSLVLFAGLAACNTVEGAGQDVQGGGEAISDTARGVERDISE